MQAFVQYLRDIRGLRAIHVRYFHTSEVPYFDVGIFDTITKTCLKVALTESALQPQTKATRTTAWQSTRFPFAMRFTLELRWCRKLKRGTHHHHHHRTSVFTTRYILYDRMKFDDACLFHFNIVGGNVIMIACIIIVSSGEHCMHTHTNHEEHRGCHKRQSSMLPYRCRTAAVFVGSVYRGCVVAFEIPRKC